MPDTLKPTAARIIPEPKTLHVLQPSYSPAPPPPQGVIIATQFVQFDHRSPGIHASTLPCSPTEDHEAIEMARKRLELPGAACPTRLIYICLYIHICTCIYKSLPRPLPISISLSVSMPISTLCLYVHKLCVYIYITYIYICICIAMSI